ncbi:2Fe-2S iron-sulfur cluster-binding protein [Phenylobacterium sp.]|uniref:2Fe-2S iron-sulfur cluster-binding protein n=1 Tax=Phenylobacterium sp. TaxID=1871053 RepID=UPI002733A1E5|nr:2Fe-2S iron-sulfur cluster-binding protein [Phenylobacterium sp.]MDP3852413.1 2Fe-2S iron-sulfur cluster-binding protein [Phenylobacterium sp.]
MPVITYVEHSGQEHRIILQPGVSLMQGAVAHGISGIDGDCGGACACATCHVYVHPDWIARLGDRNEMEASMLEFAEGVLETSRLACQIKVHADLDGLVVHLPAAQH